MGLLAVRLGSFGESQPEKRPFFPFFPDDKK